jgi:hypothetical protein
MTDDRVSGFKLNRAQSTSNQAQSYNIDFRERNDYNDDEDGTMS